MSCKEQVETMVLLHIIAGIPILIYSLYYYFTRTFNYWKKRCIIGPKPVPVIGNLKESVLRRITMGEVLADIYRSYPKEKVVGIYRMTTPCLLLRDVDIVKLIMIKDFDVFIDRGIEFSKEGLGLNLFHADGDTWRVLRNHFTPIFSSGKLKNMFYLLTERGDKFINYVARVSVKQKEQDIYSLLQVYMMSAIAACAFGIDIELSPEKLDFLRKLDKDAFKNSYLNELDMMFPGVLKLINGSFFPKYVTTFFEDLVKSVISDRNGISSNRRDFMDLMMELRQQKQLQGLKRHNHQNLSLELSDSILAAQAFIFFMAGYETSTATLSFLLHQLAIHPTIQDKVIAEIDKTLAECNYELTFDAMNKMSYLSQVFEETLRMFPVIDPLQRKAKVDYKIPGTDILIKKGQTILIPVMGIHYDEKYYPNPKQFNPDRFNVECLSSRPTCAYLPFGTGPRNCIGMRFARMQSMVCIVKLLTKFRVERSKNTVEEVKFDLLRFVTNPLGGIPLNILPRKGI